MHQAQNVFVWALSLRCHKAFSHYWRSRLTASWGILNNRLTPNGLLWRANSLRSCVNASQGLNYPSPWETGSDCFVCSKKSRERNFSCKLASLLLSLLVISCLTLCCVLSLWCVQPLPNRPKTPYHEDLSSMIFFFKVNTLYDLAHQISIEGMKDNHLRKRAVWTESSLSNF